MRPNFMEYCRPELVWPVSFLPTYYGDPSTTTWRLHEEDFVFSRTSNQWATVSSCTGESTRFALESFPSGHTASAFSVGVFLALYLNAKLKAFSDYHTSFWKMMAVLAPVFGAFFVAGSLLVDHVSSG